MFQWRHFADPLLLLPLLAGTALRLYQIHLQILADDEWHSLYAVLSRGYLSLATHFGGADYCIPLSLFYKLVYDFYGLSELIMRAPVLLAGIALIVIFPGFLRGWFGRPAALALAWLLAVSPFLVFYSRYARPYSLAVLLAGTAVIAFYRWWYDGDPAGRIVFVSCAVLAAYFHLSTLAFVSAPFGFALLEAGIVRTLTKPRLTELAKTGVMTMIGLIALLGPPLVIDVASVAGKVSEHSVKLTTLWGAAQLLAGSAKPGVVLLVFFAALSGMLISFRNRPRLSLFLVYLGAVQFVFVIMTAPVAIQAPVVLARYELAFLPFLLFFSAVAVATVECWIRTWFRLFPISLVAFAAAGVLFLAGPLPGIYYFPNNWTNHGLFEYSYDHSDQQYSYSNLLKPSHIPAFYDELGKFEPGSLSIIEAPWYYEWHNNPFPYYQQVHRQRMLVGFVDDPNQWSREGEYPAAFTKLRFRNFLHVTDDRSVSRSGARFIVFHKDLNAEIPHRAPRVPVSADRWIAAYNADFGQPVYEDEMIIVFDLMGQPQ